MDEKIQDRYLNLFTDFGFKKIFGEEINKDLLIDFLNVLLSRENRKIQDLTYMRNEHLGASESDRKAIFDLYCEDESGEKFIVELQRTKQDNFKDRALYYSSFAVQEQAKRAGWDYQLNAVYTISILNFVFDEDKDNSEKYLYHIKLADVDTNKVFHNKLTFVFIEMPKFNKTADQLKTHFDKWLYTIKNLSKLDRIPEVLREKVFERLFEVAEVAKLDKKELETYHDSLKVYRDLRNSLNTAKNEGRKEAIREMAINLLKGGVDVDIIVSSTGLTREEIEKLV